MTQRSRPMAGILAVALLAAGVLAASPAQAAPADSGGKKYTSVQINPLVTVPADAAIELTGYVSRYRSQKEARTGDLPKPVAGRSGAVSFRADGASDWQRLGALTVTGRGVGWSATVTVPEPGVLRVRYAGSAEDRPSSERMHVGVRARASVLAVHSHSTTKGKFIVSGVLATSDGPIANGVVHVDSRSIYGSHWTANVATLKTDARGGFERNLGYQSGDSFYRLRWNGRGDIASAQVTYKGE